MHSHEKSYYIYLMTNRSRTLYAGVTGNLKQRVFDHKTGACGEHESDLARFG
ncbi:MAG TPA: GIY-YIG nuclease family protein [Candidatus Angelobacter sp.]|nr:GIY-YIG nuclease family protein [Candidatus Angelobacter sp.]